MRYYNVISLLSKKPPKIFIVIFCLFSFTMNHVIIVTYITVRIISQFLTISPLLSFALLVKVFFLRNILFLLISFLHFSRPTSCHFSSTILALTLYRKGGRGPEFPPSYCNESKTDFNRICPLWTTFSC